MRKWIVLSIILGFTMTAVAQGQSTGEIKGTLSDPAGDGLAGVRVDIINAGGATIGRGTVTDMDGRYEIANLTASSYDVQYTKRGCVVRIINSVIVGADMETIINMPLRPCEGKSFEILQYKAPIINRQDTHVEQRVTQEEIRNMNVNDLAGQKAGVEQRDAGSAITIAGSRQDEVLYIVNGVPLMNGSSHIGGRP